MKKGNDGAIKVIGVFKLIKGGLLILLAAGAFRYLRQNDRATLIHFIHRLNVDPESRYFQAVATKFAGLSPRLNLIIAGTFCYGILFCTEGAGLLMHKRWAEYLTVIVTASFLPLEVYEIYKHSSVTKGIVIAVNVAILIYLARRLRQTRQSATL